MQKALIHFAHAVGQNSYHLVWKPKYAWPIFNYPSIKRDCESILRSIASKWNIGIYELQVQADHIHLFVEVPPTTTVSKVLQLLKGGSSFQLFRKYPILTKYRNFRKRHFWSRGKFFRSVGNVTSEVIEGYINDSHHGWNFSFNQQKLGSFLPHS